MAAFLSRFDARVVLVGDKGSGKTSLLHRFITHEFVQDIRSSTFETAFAAKKMELEGGQTVAIALWDTAGSPVFAHVSRMFMRGAHALILCFDVTSLQNWERLKVWAHEALTRQPNARIYLACTKMDLLQSAPHEDEPQHRRQRQQQEHRTAAPGAQKQQEHGLGLAAGPGQAAVTLSGMGVPAGTQQAQHGASLCGGSDEGEASSSPYASSLKTSSKSSPLQSEGRPGSAGAMAAGQDVEKTGQRHSGASGASGHRMNAHAVSWASDTGDGERVGEGEEDEWAVATRASLNKLTDAEGGRHEQQQQHQRELPQQQQDEQGPWEFGKAGRSRRRGASDEEVATYATSIGGRVFNVSAKTGEGVDDLFQAIAEDCCGSRSRPSSRTGVPSQQLQLQQQQQKTPSKQPTPVWAPQAQQPGTEKVVTSGPPTPTTPLLGAAYPSSFAAAAAATTAAAEAAAGGPRYSSDSSCGGSVAVSGRRPGITLSHEWLHGGGGSRSPASSGAASPVQQQPSSGQQVQQQHHPSKGSNYAAPSAAVAAHSITGSGKWQQLEYVLGESAFASGQGGPRRHVGRSPIPEIEYNKSNCRIS